MPRPSEHSVSPPIVVRPIHLAQYSNKLRAATSSQRGPHHSTAFIRLLAHLADLVHGKRAKYTCADPGPDLMVTNTVFDVCCTKEIFAPTSLGSPVSL